MGVLSILERLGLREDGGAGGLGLALGLQFLGGKRIQGVMLDWRCVCVSIYCECRNFRVVHIFALLAFPKYPRKYVCRENNLYCVVYRQ